jgi:competence protein ComEA
MLSNSERRVLLFIIVVLLVGSIAGFFRPAPEEKTQKPATFPIGINSATVDELTLLPGIGEVTAKKILKYRIKNNGFKAKNEITKVKGIGKVKFEKIKDKICVENPGEVKNDFNHKAHKEHKGIDSEIEEKK